MKIKINKKGSALVMVLLTVTVLSILGIALLQLMLNRAALKNSYVNSTGAVYAAEAGVEDLKQAFYSKIQSRSATISMELINYYNDHHTDVGFDMNAKLESLTKQYIFTEVLSERNPVHVVLGTNNSYDINFVNSDYDAVNHTIKITSTGTYNGAKRTVTDTIRLDFGNTVTVSAFEDTPIISPIPSGSTSKDNSLKINCKSFISDNTFHIPAGIAGFSSAGNTLYKFKDSFIIDEGLPINDQGIYFEVENDMKVNGNLVLGANADKIVINKGNLYVAGDIILDGPSTLLQVTQGDIICSGQIRLLKNLAKLSVGGNVYAKKAIYQEPYQGTIKSIRGKENIGNFSVSIPPVTYVRLDNTAFKTTSGVINSNHVPTSGTLNAPYLVNKYYTIGSPSNPVVIYNPNDITIELGWQNNVELTRIDIYGIVYSKKDIKIYDYGAPPALIYVHGLVITDGILDIDNNNLNIQLEYDPSIMNNIKTLYPSIYNSIFGSLGSGGGGTGGGTGGSGGGGSLSYGIVSGFTNLTWDE